MVFCAWEYAHEEDMFRFFHQALKSLRLFSEERQKGFLDSLISYLNNTIKRRTLESSLEERCRELAQCIADTMEEKQITSSVKISPQLLEQKSSGARKRKSRLSLG